MGCRLIAKDSGKSQSNSQLFSLRTLAGKPVPPPTVKVG
jgi:hypothetical protein